MQIRGILHRFFFGGPKTEIATYKTPVDMQEVEKRIKQLNAQLAAARLRDRAEQEEKKKKIKVKEQEEKEIQYILEQKKRLKKLKASKSLTLPIFGMKSFPTFFLKSNVPYKKFAGFYLRQTESGQTLWAPLLTDGQNKSIPVGPEAWTDNPINIFKSRLGMVTQLKGGKVDSNYDIIIDENSGKEMLVLYKPKYVHKSKEVKVLDISESERVEYERTVKELKKQNRDLYSRMSELDQMLITSEIKTNEAESKVMAARTEAETYKANMESMKKDYYEIMKRATETETRIIEFKAQQVQAEKLAWTLRNALDKYRKVLEEHLGKPEVDVMRTQVEEYFRAAKEFAKEMKKPPEKVVPATTKPAGVK